MEKTNLLWLFFLFHMTESIVTGNDTDCEHEFNNTAACDFYSMEEDEVHFLGNNTCLQGVSEIFTNHPECSRSWVTFYSYKVDATRIHRLEINNDTFRGYDGVQQLFLRLVDVYKKFTIKVNENTSPFLPMNSSLNALIFIANRATWMPKTMFNGMNNLTDISIQGFTFESISETFNRLQLKYFKLHYFDKQSLNLQLTGNINKIHMFGVNRMHVQNPNELQPIMLENLCKEKCEIDQLILCSYNIMNVDSDFFENVEIRKLVLTYNTYDPDAFRNLTIALSEQQNFTLEISRPIILDLDKPFLISEINEICNNMNKQNFTLQLNKFPSQVTFIPKGIFQNCTHIHTLRLTGWFAKYIIVNENSVIGLENLRVLEMSYMSITALNHLKLLPNLETLNLTKSFVDLAISDILENQSSNITNININYVAIGKGLFRDLLKIFPHNLKVLSARGYYKVTKDNIPPITTSSFFLPSLQKIDWSDTPDLFDERYFTKYIPDPTIYFSGIKNLTHLWLSKTKFGINLSSYYPDIFQPIAHTLQYLSLADSELQEFYNNNITLQFQSLQHLDLSGNRISQLQFSKDKNTFPALKYLDLSRNSLQFIDSHTVEAFKEMNKNSLTHLILNNNRFVCGCKLRTLANWLRELHDSNKSIDGGIEPTCTDKNSGATRLVREDYSLFFICLLKALGRLSLELLGRIGPYLLGGIALMTLCYLYRWKLRFMLLLLRILLAKEKFIKEKRKIFVAYHKDDIPWIVETLIPKFQKREIELNETMPLLTSSMINECNESTNKKTLFERSLNRVARGLGLHLFIKDRDMIYGVPEAEQIAIEINSSQVVLLLASKKFFQSPECLFQSQVAQHDMLEQIRSKVMIFFLEKVDKRDLPVWLKFPMPLLRRVLPCFEYNKIKNKTSGKKIEELWIRLILACAGKCKLKNEFLQ